MIKFSYKLGLDETYIKDGFTYSSKFKIFMGLWGYLSDNLDCNITFPSNPKIE